MAKNEPNSYFRVQISGLSAPKEEIISFVCFEHGALGISESLPFDQPNLVYEARILSQKNHLLDAYFSQTPPLIFFEKLKEIDPKIEYKVFEEAQKDWLSEWKKGYQSFALVKDYWIVPSWLESPVPSEKTLRIDPGMAFGTGTHPTTQMASYFIHKLISSEMPFKKRSILDVGTGTAVLLILAHKMGLKKLVGIDSDPEARQVARNNIIINSISEIEIREENLEEIKETFDLVVANIIDGILLQLKPHLLRVLNEDGQLFLTGILLEREDAFLKEFLHQSHLKIHRRLEKDEWVGFWLKRSK